MTEFTVILQSASPTPNSSQKDAFITRAELTREVEQQKVTQTKNEELFQRQGESIRRIEDFLLEQQRKRIAEQKLEERFPPPLISRAAIQQRARGM